MKGKLEIDAAEPPDGFLSHGLITATVKARGMKPINIDRLIILI